MWNQRFNIVICILSHFYQAMKGVCPLCHLHNALHNGFFETYLVMFQQDPRCHTKPVFGCLEHAKVAAGKVCHLLWMPLLIVWGQDEILHTFWVVGCYSGRTRACVWAWARGNVFGSMIFVMLPNTTKQISDNFVVQSIMQMTISNHNATFWPHFEFVESCPIGGPGYSCYLLLSNLTGSRYNFRYNLQRCGFTVARNSKCWPNPKPLPRQLKLWVQAMYATWAPEQRAKCWGAVINADSSCHTATPANDNTK